MKNIQGVSPSNHGKRTRVYRINGADPDCKDWQEGARKVAVDCFPWGESAKDDFRPATVARLGTDGASIFVFMETDEDELRAETKGFGYTHADSCMEFFLAPDPACSGKYLNWEFNPAGGMYLSVGTSRHDRIDIPEENYRELFQVKTVVHGKGWTLQYCIPLSFLRRFFPSLELKPGHVMRGNFYKCGDDTPRPHFGCWSPIYLPQPDFHCPEFFGELVICGESIS